MYSFQEMLFSAAVAMYIAVSVCIGAIRWGHKCEPYARHADYYYPAWKAVVFCYMSDLLLVPIVFMPYRYVACQSVLCLMQSVGNA